MIALRNISNYIWKTPTKLKYFAPSSQPSRFRRLIHDGSFKDPYLKNSYNLFADNYHQNLSFHPPSCTRLTGMASHQTFAKRNMSTSVGGDKSPDTKEFGSEGLGKDFFAADSFPQDTLIDPYTAHASKFPPEVETMAQTTSASAAVSDTGLTGLESIGYAPTELVMRAIEIIHLTTGMPYWGSIVISTLALRTLTLPIHIQTKKSAAKMVIGLTEFKARNKKMKKNPTPEQLQAWRKKHGLSIIELIIMYPFLKMPILLYTDPFLKMPIFVSMFYGLKEMGAHFPGFATGGFGPFTDLAAADPSYILPFATGVLFLGMVEVLSLQRPKSPMPINVKMFVRVMAITVLPLTTYQFPSGFFIFWMTSNAFTLMQSLALKIPTVRAALGIPEIPQKVKNMLKKFTQK
mmetsp:Transcript_40809/g.53775  ORF Transcript_40809/g.53775 Transcript_40809/m.53775 type:complete len:405 (-) Transcript_40809:358-1572(-)